MSDIIRKPYEISLWDEETVYCNNVQGIVIEQPQAGDVVNQYLKEGKLAVIGSSALTTPISAYNIKFKQELNGMNTLTFVLNYRYYDEEKEEYLINPFISLMTNERIVRLFYDEQWYTFLIKQIQEDKERNQFSYTCTDFFIDELSKTGYEVELDTELENNMGTIGALAAKVLDNTDWTYEVPDVIRQRNRELVYSFQPTSTWTVTVLEDASINGVQYTKGQSVIVPSGKLVYVFHSCIVNKENPVQLLYNPDGVYNIDKDDVLIDCLNISGSPGIVNNYQATFNSNQHYFGKRLVGQQITKYIAEIDRYCGEYTKKNDTSGTIYYGYVENEYASVAEIQNLLTNSSNFISTSGWAATGSGYVSLTNGIVNNKFTSAILLYGTTSSSYVTNTGLYNSRKSLGGFVVGEKFIFCCKPLVSGSPNVSNIKCVVTTVEGTSSTILSFSNYSGTEIPTSLSSNGYYVYQATCTQSISYEQLLKCNIELRLNASSAKLVDAKLFKKVIGFNGKFIVPELEDTMNSIVKRNVYFFNSNLINTEPRFVYSVDDIVFDSIVEYDKAQDYFTPIMNADFEKITSITESKSNRFNLIQTLCERFECWAKIQVEYDELGRIEYVYEPFIGTPSVKHTYYRQINAGQSHKDYGIAATDDVFSYTLVPSGQSINTSVRYYNANHEELLYNEANFTNNNPNPIGLPQWGFKSGMSYYTLNPITQTNLIFTRRRKKKIIFKEFIGQENQTGFRYGINLKSIQRNIESDNIVTKLIVEPNSNEYAENGSCSIQTALFNPTGENALFNFDYYVRQGLLDKEAVYRELYGADGNIGIFEQIRRLNDQTHSPIIELSKLSNTINNLTSREFVYNTIIQESQEMYNEALSELTIALGSATNAATVTYNSSTHNASIQTMTLRRDRAKQSMDSYASILSTTTSLVKLYNQKYATILHSLNQITQQKQRILNDFYNRYARYIREGTWISEDYYDSDKYYTEAAVVLQRSAFPLVSYNINVLEISQIEGYEQYRFGIGDKTYIEDTEFFGWDNKMRPYKEEVVVSEVTYGLDDNSQNTIKIQNYKTQFDDLFQRITATTQSLQYAEGRYERATKITNESGNEIDDVLLQDSINNNALVIKNAKDESVVWNETGITISNFINPNKIVRLVSGGIVLSEDGGSTWTTGITGSGINANVITTGQLNTNLIRIYDGANPTFQWNARGIHAYALSNDGSINFNKFVRMDKFGIYGYNGSSDFAPTGTSDIKGDAVFALLWDGLYINSTTSSDYVRIQCEKNTSSSKTKVISAGSSGSDKFILYSDGSIMAKEGTFSGTLSAATGTFSGSLSAATGTFSGTLSGATGTFSGALNVGTSSYSGRYNFEVTSSGTLRIGPNSSTGSNFSVSSTGVVTANDIVINGNGGTSKLINTSGFNVKQNGDVTISGNLTVSGSAQMAGNITASALAGNEISISGYGYGYLGFRMNSAGTYALSMWSDQGIRIETSSGNVYLASGSNPSLTLDRSGLVQIWGTTLKFNETVLASR